MNIEERLSQALSEWHLWGLNCDEQPKVVKTFTAGLTNHNFLIASGNKEWVLRLNNQNYSQVPVKREFELQIHRYAAQYKISPRIIYSSDAHYLVREYIAGQTLTIESLTANHLTQMAQTLGKTHDFNGNELDIPQLGFSGKVSHYMHQIIRENPGEYEWLRELEATCKTIGGELQRTERPCHMDPLPSNWIESDSGQLYLIDWEYSALANPLLDFASLYLKLPTKLRGTWLAINDIKKTPDWNAALQQIEILELLWNVSMGVDTLESLRKLDLESILEN